MRAGRLILKERDACIQVSRDMASKIVEGWDPVGSSYATSAPQIAGWYREVGDEIAKRDNLPDCGLPS
jgi:hypothetical protein